LKTQERHVGNSLLLTETEKYKWFLLASESRFEHTAKYAKDWLAALKPVLSKSQIEDAGRSANLWKLMLKRQAV
jgi:hypothetical protein